MFYLFLGESYFRKQHLTKRKELFAQKHSDLQIIHVRDPFSYHANFYYQNLLGNGLFSEKKLLIIDEFPFVAGAKDDSQAQQILQDVFLEVLPKLSPDTTFIFNNEKVDKRTALYKLITTHGTLKDFSISTPDALRAKILGEFGEKLSPRALDRLIVLKGAHFGLIQQELDKLFLTKSFVDVSDLQHIDAELEENIFQLVDFIASKHIIQAIEMIRETYLHFESMYSFYNMLLAQLRVYYYIVFLQYKGISTPEISQLMNLGKRDFLIGKAKNIHKEFFFSLYQRLASIDSKMKQGNLIGNDGEDFLYEIENILLTTPS